MHVILLTAVLLIGTVSTVLAQVTQPKTLISSGGVHSATGSLTMSSNVGDVIAGHSTSGTVDAWHGFYAPAPVQVTGVDGPKSTFVSFLGTPQPNPARLNLSIEFGNAVEQNVDVGIYDVAGRLVRQLYRGRMHAGVFRETWNLRSGSGQAVDAGVYFVRLTAGTYGFATRCVVIH